MLLDMFARRFEQFAILHAAWTRDFTGSAAQAKVDVPHGSGVEGRAPILKRAHQVDAPAR